MKEPEELLQEGEQLNPHEKSFFEKPSQNSIDGHVHKKLFGLFKIHNIRVVIIPCTESEN